MNFVLDPIESRVLGALLEKELTTPDAYPLSLAALTAACNQKSSREPVMSLDEATVENAVNTLVQKHLVRLRSGAGSRVAKYAHRLAGTLDPAEELSQRERAVVGLLLLRGPQTVGELRTRTGRMHEFADLAEVEQTLAALGVRKEGPYVRELPRQAGQRETRFMHLLGGSAPPVTRAEEPAAPGVSGKLDRLAALEDEMAMLRAEMSELRAQVAALESAHDDE